MQVSSNTITGPAASTTSTSSLVATEEATRGKASNYPIAPDFIGEADTTAISPAATLLARALSVATAESAQPSSPLLAQVQQLTASMLNGAYKVDPDVLASSVMDTMLQPRAD